MDLAQAPKSKDSVITGENIAEKLSCLLGTPFTLTFKARTDGANLRKVITSVLCKSINEVANNDDYIILTPKGKGIPKLLAVLADSYIVTSGNSYNLQVWNRIPNSSSPLIAYSDGCHISSKDIRLIMVKINMGDMTIESIIVMSPEYIETHFGNFGKPTIKHQLLISAFEREKIIKEGGIYSGSDTDKIESKSLKKYVQPNGKSEDAPLAETLFSIDLIKDLVAEKLIGQYIDNSDTKTRGQSLEKKVIELLGYDSTSKLVGGYPDVPNQLLEIKVQDTQTVDLGKYSPQFEQITDYSEFTTFDVRYLIALTNPTNHIIEGVILSNGKDLGEKFTYVSDKSYKCQRTIPMSFFEQHSGKSLFNP